MSTLFLIHNCILTPEKFQGFIIGIASSIFAALLLNHLSSNYYARIKYRRFLGHYKHPKGKVEIKHLKGDYFQAKGIENSAVTWTSNLKYLNNSVFVGVYDWNPDSGISDWGEHNLHVLPNGNISVIWVNKSVEKEKKGRLIWEKEK